MSFDWQKRVQQIEKEMKFNVERTQQLRGQIRPIKDEIKVLKLTEDKVAMKEKVEELEPLDKEFNKLRSDYYFLNAELTEAKRQLEAQK